jgi:hypothetical protein
MLLPIITSLLYVLSGTAATLVRTQAGDSHHTPQHAKDSASHPLSHINAGKDVQHRDSNGRLSPSLAEDFDTSRMMTQDAESSYSVQSKERMNAKRRKWQQDYRLRVKMGLNAIGEKGRRRKGFDLIDPRYKQKLAK